MRRAIFVGLTIVMFLLGTAGVSFGYIIDFAGGTAYLSDGTTVATNDTDLYIDNVDYYVEDGFLIDFVGGYGTIGDYYSIGIEGTVYQNSVIHAHWLDLTAITFTKLDGAAFDLNYMDLTSNTEIGGGQATGNELSYVTTLAGDSMLLPSSDWGLDYDYYGEPGDGIERLWMNSDFDDIFGFTVTSQNAYCFGLDNFYIDEEPPPIPEPGTLLLLGVGLVGLLAAGRKKFLRQ